MTQHPAKVVIQFPGAKSKLAGRIIQMLGYDHGGYIEPYFGSGAVLLAKPPVRVEQANDLDHELINFFRVLRKRATRYDLIDALTYTPHARYELEEAHGLHDPEGFVPDKVERARRFMVRANQTFVGGGSQAWVVTTSLSGGHTNAIKWNNFRTRLNVVAERLQNVQIECTDGVRILEKVLAQRAEGIAVYLDPPYPEETRAGSKYRQEMTGEQHVAMLERAVQLVGPTVVSTYANQLYTDVLTVAGWTCYDIPVQGSSRAGKGSAAKRVEQLWANRVCQPLVMPLTVATVGEDKNQENDPEDSETLPEVV